MAIHSILKTQVSLICPSCNRNKVCSYLEQSSANLKCSNCLKTYPIIEGVPVLSEEILSSEIIEKKANLTSSLNDPASFYYQLYSGRSREIDIQSDYLSQERGFIENFIKDNKIDGLCLEVGCGTGIFAECSSNYIGLDYSFSSVFAEGFNNFARLIASGESIPFPNESVQLIFTFNTLEHIPNPELAFHEIDRILRPNGYAILKPAWHCTKYNTELLPIKSYKELTLTQRISKSLIPLYKNKIYKLITRIPQRIVRRVFYYLYNKKIPTSLQYRRLTPYLGKDAYIADCDATADIDCHEGLLYFESRGYKVLSHKTVFSRLLAGNDLLILQKIADQKSNLSN